MELGFIASALRRYAWIVVVCALAGLIPGLVNGGGVARYESRGVLSIVPPADAAGAYIGDPDRFVIGQLSVLRSTTFAEAVAARIDDGDAAVVADAVRFEHLDETDIVIVEARSGDAEFSQLVVNGYLDEYVATLERQVADAQQPIDEQISATEQALDEVDAQIAQAILPYLEITPGDEGGRPIPGVDQVAPSLASSQSLLRSTLVDLQRERASIQTSSRVEGVIVERATVASAPSTDSNRLLLVAGVAAGAFVGVLIAVVTARLSPRVLDDRHVDEILGRPPMGALPYAQSLSDNLKAALGRPPKSVASFIDALSVRVEASGRPGEPLTVLVVGGDRGVGTTTLAALLARGLAASGSRALLVDADRQNPSLTALTGPSPQPRSAKRLLQNVTPTARATLSIATLTGDRGSAELRRRNLGEAVDEATKLADSTVFDGGSLLDSATALELARRSDCVVLVLTPRQRAQSLDVIASELGDRQVIPVWSDSRGSLWRRLLSFLGLRQHQRGDAPSADRSRPGRPTAGDVPSRPDPDSLDGAEAQPSESR